MAVPAVNITIEKGVYFENTFTINNSDGTPLNLSGYSAVSKIKKHPSSSSSHSFSVSITASTGKIVISMGNTTTSELSEGRNYYDIVVTSSGGIKSRVIEGMALVTPSISV
jgi:hypothetical protein